MALLSQAAGMSAATTIDDMLVLAVFFGQVKGNRAAIARIVLGEYLGFGAILAISVIGALGAAQLPRAAIPYSGLIPLSLGLRAAWLAWRQHGRDGGDVTDVGKASGLRVIQVALISFANGGNNVGVYVPVFAVVGMSATIDYAALLLLGVAVWCAISWCFVSRPAMARAMSRWGHLLLPVVLIGIGLEILIEGGVFGL
jgi:cadmium resistance protein CadD (predicted permease)